MNESGWFNPPLPSIGPNDVLFAHMPFNALKTEWERIVMKLTTGGGGRWEFSEYMQFLHR